MIKFGPSGLCEQFAQSGNKHTIEAGKWLSDQGLDCFEYSFGRGVQIKPETANEIGKEFAKNNIEISVHAPYFINLATLEEDKANNNHRYIMDSLAALRAFGGNRCVFHPGSPLKASRSEAMHTLLKRFELVLKLKEENGFSDLLLCPETMGKKAQLGNLEEVISMCNIGDDNIVPCIDFGHLNSRDCGIYFTCDDYKRTIDRLLEGVGESKTNRMHVHFSKIQYTANGELRHLTFDDEIYGPDYQPLMEVFAQYKLNPYVVCESAGTQTRDALAMKTYYNSILK
ncbi:MAG: TIM barrel protein [Clostridia bacterium]|nr:TIM barrel protein [Clostridia bacterium]